MTETREQYAVVPVIPATMMPAVNMESMLQRRSQMVEFFKRILVDGTDYGTIPGTQKPTLLKPGAEKLKMFFGLTHSFEIMEKIEDWEKPLFYYLVRCHMYYNGTEVGQGDGSCNSREIKYRYRQADRVCPNCGKPTIMRGKAEYGGGWLCFAKRGGCGAKFKAGDKSIEGQETGRIENPDVADVVNTILKQAEKRSFVGSVIITTNASEFVTQDLEDGVIEGEYEEKSADEPTKSGNGKPQPSRMFKPAQSPPAEPPEAPPSMNESEQPVQPVDSTMPNTARKLLTYVNERVQASYDNLSHLQNAIRLELGDAGWSWRAPTDYVGWGVARDAAMIHATRKVSTPVETVKLDAVLDAPFTKEDGNNG